MFLIESLKVVVQPLQDVNVSRIDAGCLNKVLDRFRGVGRVWVRFPGDIPQRIGQNLMNGEVIRLQLGKLAKQFHCPVRVASENRSIDFSTKLGDLIARLQPVITAASNRDDGDDQQREYHCSAGAIRSRHD